MSGIDLSELEALTASIAASTAIVQREGAAIVKRGAQNIKTDWRANAAATAGAHARLYPASISYDVTEAPGVIEAEIGPDKAKLQGPLGNLLEFGSANSPPHNDGGRALGEEEPRFQAQVDALRLRALGP
ncbi:hypothetical protein ACFO3J_24140 [Streptomyces polygonati]|uniref:HK97 gp10 family phage protein n=1 Tax=Streptomyces polygonati TaxID=1617087 RepID=A0ABV8HTS0_9ACTN